MAAILKSNLIQVTSQTYAGVLCERQETERLRRYCGRTIVCHLLLPVARERYQTHQQPKSLLMALQYSRTCKEFQNELALPKQQRIKVTFKPQITIKSLFPRPKAQNDADQPKSGIVYKISCTNCEFVYYGQTERQLKTKLTEHKKTVFVFDYNSKVACLVHENNYHIDFGNVKLLDVRQISAHERLFLRRLGRSKRPKRW